MARLHKATPGVSLRSFVVKLGNQTVGDSGIHIKDWISRNVKVNVEIEHDLTWKYMD